MVAAAVLKGKPLTVTSTCTLARPPQLQGHVQIVTPSLLPLGIGARARAVAVVAGGGGGGAAAEARACSCCAMLAAARGSGAGFLHTYFPSGLEAWASRASVRRRQSPHSRPKHGKLHFAQGVFLAWCQDSSRVRRFGRRSSPALPEFDPLDFFLSGIVHSSVALFTIHYSRGARLGAARQRTRSADSGRVSLAGGTLTD